jgi:hypothetical protein
MNRLLKAFVLAMLFVNPIPVFAEEATTQPCEPQPTCEFSNLVIKPGAPTPGAKLQDIIRPGGTGGVDTQSGQPSDLRGSYRLPEGAESGVRLAR